MVEAGAYAALVFGAGAAYADDILPLRHGYYVRVGTPCERASNATTNLFDGKRVGQAHMACEPTTSSRESDDTYRVTESCTDQQSPQPIRQTVVTLYRVISPTEFEVDGYQVRYCPQAELPSPWCCVELPPADER